MATVKPPRYVVLRMKFLHYPLLLCVLVVTAQAENTTTQTPLTMEQLMRELRIQGGNFIFTFDEPVYAKVTVTTTEYPNGKATTTEFVSDKSNKTIDLFFSASAQQVGDYPRGDRAMQPRKMKIKLSDCEATHGTRIIGYIDKFAENQYRDGGIVGQFEPSLPLHPQLNKEYVLHYYFKEGDPYEAKATISFAESLAGFSSVEKFDRNGVRR